MSETLYYVENTKTPGELAQWWRRSNMGYNCLIPEARVFSQDELDEMISIQLGEKRAWPKKYIDSYGDHSILRSELADEQAYKPQKG